MNLPQHIVIIPDGNRRWAKKKGLPSFMGHLEGAKTTEKVLKTILDLKIPYCTFWGSSFDNISKRQKIEVDFLFKVFQKYFKRLIVNKDVFDNKIKINVFGRWEEVFPEQVKKVIKSVIEKTKTHKNFQQTFLMAYSGLDEMKIAINKIAELKANNSTIKIDENLIKSNLWTKDLPPVDLVIRTGGEPHWSAGLMMWDVANAQLHFSKTLWPDFSSEELNAILVEYGSTDRRLGK